MARRHPATVPEIELAIARGHAERRDARMNETMSRRDVLDAIDTVLYAAECSEDGMRTLRALREAFE